jgi:uncharacterized protein YvpB
MTLSKQQLSLLPSHNLFFTPNKLKSIVINKNLSVIISAPVKAPFAFDSLILSISAKLQKDAAILLQAAVETEAGWSGFYKLAYISNTYKKTFEPQKDEFASTDIDTLLCKKPANRFKYQITILGKAKINLLCAALTNSTAFYDKELAQETLDLKDFELPLAPISQMELEDKTIANKICSPAALTAVLNYYGKKVNLADIVKAVYDENAKIYGTWPLNTAVAAQAGLNACVVRCSSLAQAEGEIYKGRPVIVSIGFKKGKLKNAPQQATAGHLVVITGFDKKGDVIVMDPAAKTAKDARRVYSRAQFAEAWLKNKKGLTYAIED